VLARVARYALDVPRLPEGDAVSPLVLAAGGEGFTPPGPEDFWWPIVGSDTSAWTLTRPAVMVLFSVALIAWFFLAATKRRSLVPGKLQFVGEGVYGFVREGIGRDLIGSKDFRRFLPLLFTQFTLILVNNVFGIIPFVQFPTMSRIGFPIALTIVTYLVFHAVGLRKKGVGGYLKDLVPPGLPGWIVPFIFLLEFVDKFITRPITLSLRLFANMFAGHLLLLVFILGAEHMILDLGPGFKVVGLLSALLAIVMTFFELLVEVLQAYIFTLLTALYIGGALAEEH
jgi:F-type H+-transporting ATPase subunit a